MVLFIFERVNDDCRSLRKHTLSRDVELIPNRLLRAIPGLGVEVFLAARGGNLLPTVGLAQNGR
jgi:hypothetical protein